jgi:hypothetical protein
LVVPFSEPGAPGSGSHFACVWHRVAPPEGAAEATGDRQEHEALVSSSPVEPLLGQLGECQLLGAREGLLLFAWPERDLFGESFCDVARIDRPPRHVGRAQKDR